MDDLTDRELEILPQVVSTLKKKTKANPVTNAQIVTGLKKHLNYTTSQPRVRKIISYIRIKGLITNLVGDNTGYYCTTDQKELDKWIEQMKQRAAAILASAEKACIPGTQKELIL